MINKPKNFERQFLSKDEITTKLNNKFMQEYNHLIQFINENIENAIDEGKLRCKLYVDKYSEWSKYKAIKKLNEEGYVAFEDNLLEIGSRAYLFIRWKDVV